MLLLKGVMRVLQPVMKQSGYSAKTMSHLKLESVEVFN